MIRLLRLLFSVSFWCLLLATSAAASDGRNECVQAYEDGQRLRQTGALVEAESRLLACGGPECPVRMQRDCQGWLDDVRRSIPTVIFRVRDETGSVLGNVRLSIDDGPWQRLDGRAVLMNPGEHVVAFERTGYEPRRTPVFVTEGEKLEPREIFLTPLATPQPASSARTELHPSSDETSAKVLRQGRSASHWVLPVAAGAVGVLGAASFGYFGLQAIHDERALDRCTPNCSQDQVDDVRRQYRVSNVSLGVSIVGLVAAGVWLLLDEAGQDASVTAWHPTGVGMIGTRF
jgi:hypothetical protein